jgi:membrane protein YqaA with SNARE-associated domain
MKLFGRVYQQMLVWARHRYAVRYLTGLSFAESSFFPIPPDVMLIPMAYANRPKAWRYALFTTIASVLGGVLGYFIGYMAFDMVEPLIVQSGHQSHFQQVQLWFDHWGIWVVFLAGFSPIPYKLFTIAAGMMSMMLVPFIVASLIGRGGRFFLVAGLVVWGGDSFQYQVERYIERIGWFLVMLLVLVGLWISGF